MRHGWMHQQANLKIDKHGSLYNNRYLPVFIVKLSWAAMYETSGHVSALQSAFQIRMAGQSCWTHSMLKWFALDMLRPIDVMLIWMDTLPSVFFKNPQFRNHLKRKLSILWEFGCLLMFSLIRLPDKAGPIAQHYQLQVFCSTRKHQHHEE